MRFIYWGPFSGGIEVHVAMGVGFRGREPSETLDPAAISWLSGNPLFEQVPDAPEEAPKPKKAKRKGKKA